jgi:hypothetical protein
LQVQLGPLFLPQGKQFCISNGGSTHASFSDYRSYILHLCIDKAVPISILL